MLEFTQEDYDRLMGLIEASDMDSSQKAFYRKNLVTRYLIYFQTVDKAFEAILGNAKWRKEIGIDTLGPENDEYIKKELDAKKGFILDGFDYEGRPMFLIKVKNHNAYERDQDGMSRFLAYMFEKVDKLCPEDNINGVSVVFDLEGVGLKNIDYQFIKQLLHLFTYHYPKRFGNFIVINSSYFTNSCWLIIRPWISERSRKKIIFAGKNELSKYFDTNILEPYKDL